MTTIRAFFSKLGHFFLIFQKRQGRPPASSYAPVLLLQYIRCLLLVQMEKASKKLNLISHFHSVSFIGVIFFFHVFPVFLCFVSFFLVAAHEKDSLRTD